MVKAVVFSNDQAEAVVLALKARVEKLEELLASGMFSEAWAMSGRDQLEVARQALDVIEGAN